MALSLRGQINVITETMVESETIFAEQGAGLEIMFLSFVQYSKWSSKNICLWDWNKVLLSVRLSLCSTAFLLHIYQADGCGKPTIRK